MNMTLLSASLLLLAIFIPFDAVAQNCKPSIAATTNEATFTLTRDGTAIHQVTGLMWMRCSLGQKWDGNGCLGEAATFSWGGALQAANRNVFAGHTDWRLPNKNELETILEESCSAPAINARVFPATPPAYFWTSSPYYSLGRGAWSIDFAYGLVNASVKSGNLNVRLVRGGRDQ
jgi:hypothetical protein